MHLRVRSPKGNLNNRGVPSLLMGVCIGVGVLVSR